MSFCNEPARAFAVHLSSCCVQLCILLIQTKAGSCCQEIMRGLENIIHKEILREMNLLSLEMSGLDQSQHRCLLWIVVNLSSGMNSLCPQWIKFGTVKTFLMMYSARVYPLDLQTFYTGRKVFSLWEKERNREEVTSQLPFQFFTSLILLEHE